MNWLNIYIPHIVRAPEFVGSEPIDQATWLKLSAFCAEQENGGLLVDCEDWGERRWMATCVVTLEEVRRVSPLWTWEGKSIRVWRYPVDSEESFRASRIGGRNGGLKSGQVRREAKLQAQLEPPLEPPLEAGVERKGREGKERKDKEREEEGNPRAWEAKEVPSEDQAKAGVATDGIPDNFVKLVYADWIDNAGRNSKGADVDVVGWIRKRWRYEGTDWRNGTHSANRANGDAKGKPALTPHGINLLIEAKGKEITELSDRKRGGEKLSPSEVARWKKLAAEVVECRTKLAEMNP